MDLSTLSTADWHGAAGEVLAATPSQLFIDGEYVAAQGDAKLESINPANGNVIATFSAGSSVDIDRAVASARAGNGTRARAGS